MLRYNKDDPDRFSAPLDHLRQRIADLARPPNRWLKNLLDNKATSATRAKRPKPK
jgi:hypothetical protein